MDDSWIVLELGPKAEGEDPDIIRRSIRHVVKDAEVFIPAAVTSVGEEKVVRYLVEGYAFIRRTQPDQTYMRLVGTRFVNSLLKTGRQLATVSPREIEKMRMQVRSESEQGIEVGDTVMIMSGPYRQISAVVHEDIPELKSVQLFIRLRSKEAMVTLPRNCLRLISKSSKSSDESRASDLVNWFDMVLPIVRWGRGAATRLTTSHSAYTKVQDLSRRFDAHVGEFYALVDLDKRPAHSLPATLRSKNERFQQINLWLQQREWLGLGKTELHTEPLRKTFSRLRRITSYDERFRPITKFIGAIGSPAEKIPARLKKRLTEITWIGGIIDRIQAIGEDVRMIEGEMASASEDVDMDTNPSSSTVVVGDAETMFIDGLNLAVRCSYAQGLSELRDRQGRLTGVFYGFLNSLSSLRKRFPNALQTVVWDGSSRRRKDVFAGYKAGRGPLPVSDWQLEWLRGTLPLIGVEQAWNPQEEADDVIATLVHANPGKRNVVFSTDRDLMQLVTANTIWLSPAVGKAKETAYDCKAIEAKWGVGPEQIVLLRAFLGDSSDEIPGLGLPHKVVTSLVQAYGSVDRLYSAKLAGISKLQYDKLRAAEATVRRNVGLMTLCTDLVVSTVPPTPDRIAADKRLRDADVKPDSILAAFFGSVGTDR